MKSYFKASAAGLFLGLLLTGSAYAGPVTPSSPSQGEDRPMTRAELVQDIERILARWEEQSQIYASKDEVAELRTMIEEMRKELGSSEGQDKGLEQSLDALEQRVEHLPRPGF